MTISDIEYQDLSESIKTTDSLGTRYELIKDVKVNLSVSVGDCEISVSELFDLKDGSVISLNRDVFAPVDVMHNGKVIARGDLVAVGDNFGVRITEIDQ